ncbi:MAG: DUF3488 and transglutaminase-like domain-containing protein [Burkholderiaceae bacterium]|nr:DUF3488 and transglutaminase-like domain-containing protein [Burkholderiaceae bacterium]
MPLQRLQRAQRDNLLLLLAALLVLLPHTLHLPWWISACITLLLGWRALLTWRDWRMPPIWLLLPLALGAMAGVRAEFHLWLGRDAGIAMLTLLLGFKLLEMHSRRDVLVVILLCHFVLLGNFFYTQSMLMALHAGLALLLVLTAQLSFQYSDQQAPLGARLLLILRMLLLGAPLALLLFIVFPRIQGPLWGLPGDAHAGTTGLSDSMAPGSIAALAQSDAIAFRVRFGTDRPAPAQLYWRSIVLGAYDGRIWTRVAARAGWPAQLSPAATQESPPVNYEITLEPQHHRWLPALELSTPPLQLTSYRARDTEALEFFTATVPTETLRYSASAGRHDRLQPEATGTALQRWLTLPAGYNPRTLALATSLAADHAPAPVLTQRLLQYLRAGAYTYTLEPPLLGRHAVDEFLFDSKAGFCEHYAGAFVVALRAMGIPARVVTGYQGGEFNPVDGVLSVRQSDAHAWAEYWQADSGWQRVDPTAAVAPQRLDPPALRRPPYAGSLGALQSRAASLFDTLRFEVAALENAWNLWVLDYTPDRQQALLSGAQVPQLSWRLGTGALASTMLLCGLVWWRRQTRGDPLQQLYRRFCQQQARHGYPRGAAEGPQAYAARLTSMPASAAKQHAMQEFLTLYSRLQYGAGSTESRTTSLATLRKLLPLCR